MLRIFKLVIFLLLIRVSIIQAVNINPLSVKSLYLEIKSTTTITYSATGFIVQNKEKYYLITNWHVVTGRHPNTNQIINNGIPKYITIYHHGVKLGDWSPKIEPLYDINNNPRWIEHSQGQKIDVILLPLENIDNTVKIYPFDLSLAHTDMVPEVAMPVSIIGFPKGFNGNNAFPIWKTGHVASEPGLDYEGKPCFLIDAATRGGMSGSPVVLRLSGGYKEKNGDSIISGSRMATLFLGVYSGRLPFDSDIGIIWKPQVIPEIIKQIKK